MSQWAPSVVVGVVVVLAAGAMAGCSTSDSTSDEVAELRDQVEELTGLLDGRDERIDELTAQLDELEAAAEATATTEPPVPTTEAGAVDAAQVEAILPLATDLPGDWSEEPFGALGLEQIGVEFLLVSPCGFGPTGDVDDPLAVAETSFSSGGFTGPLLSIAVVRFEDDGSIAQPMGRLVAESADCETFFEAPEGRTTISPLDLVVDGAEVAASRTSFEVDEDGSSFAIGGNSHDVIARVGPYVIVVSHFSEDGEPDLAVTTAVVEAMVARATEALG